MTKGRLLKPNEVAEQLSVSLVTVKKWLREGRLKGVKVSRIWHVYESNLEEMIKEVQEESEEEQL
ncbi:hypothetical protein JIR001_16660 [Polycladomyces abyssicola]|uniref:Helix-turn-helix domain-containing protein n=1 Tax=Polycladomyces abyssicola TaxID=1125966 RepID=A0A8D5UFS4_9BACL|nr:helix-turn-helix domain-containing protein [Polycladomyces abyssicola]BCU81883.1 hypothetical protein JIR001_16660 [Polycladomyces abyssicola]